MTSVPGLAPTVSVMETLAARVTCALCGGEVRFPPSSSTIRSSSVTCLDCGPVRPPVPAVSRRQQWLTLCKRWAVNPTYARISAVPNPTTAAALTLLVKAIGRGAPKRALLYGPTGTGKTTAAFAVLSWLIGEGHLEFADIAITRESDLLVPFTDDRGRWVNPDFRRHLAGKRVVVLEEFGRAHYPPSMDGGVEARLALLDWVVANDVSMIITTNVALDQMGAVLGDAAVAERLWAMIDQTPLTVAAASLRRVSLPWVSRGR